MLRWLALAIEAHHHGMSFMATLQDHKSLPGQRNLDWSYSSVKFHTHCARSLTMKIRFEQNLSKPQYIYPSKILGQPSQQRSLAVQVCICKHVPHWLFALWLHVHAHGPSPQVLGNRCAIKSVCGEFQNYSSTTIWLVILWQVIKTSSLWRKLVANLPFD